MKIRRLLIATMTMACMSFGGLVQANIVTENFDSYANHAALAAVWNANAAAANGGAGPTNYVLDTTFGNPGQSYRMGTPVNFEQRLARNLPGGSIQASDANPLQISFDLYLNPAGATGWNGARHYIELRGHANGSFGNGALTNLIAMGVNNASDNTFSTLSYQGRVINSGATGWQTLNGVGGAPTRQAGWQNLGFIIYSDEVEFYVNNVLSHVVARPQFSTFAFDSIVLGSSLTNNNHAMSIDNLTVSVVPEPSSVALSMLGLCGLAIYRRRKS